MAAPRVLVPEKLSAEGLSLLKKSLQVDERKGLSADELKQIIPEYDALLVRSETKVTEELLKAGNKLKVVGRAGVGVDNIDVPAATKLGIVVVNSPSGNIGAAAEHTIALLCATARNIGDGCSSLKAGKWERSRLVGVEYKGKTLGIIGLGKVGLTVARLAVGLGMRVTALDPYASPAIAQAASVHLVPSMDDLLPTCDWLTIHTPLMASTKDLISAREIAKMKRSSRLLNVARGGVINEAALLEALESGHVAGAGIDVFTSEPPAPDSAAARLIAHPHTVATPHLGASTVEAQENVSIDVCEQVISILSGDLPRSAVNAPLILPEEFKTLQPFVRLVEKMGALYTQYFSSANQGSGGEGGEGNTTSFELSYEGALATLTNTKPLFAALVKGLIASVSRTNVTIVNAEMVARERGIVVNEQKSRDSSSQTYSSLVTLRARPSAASRGTSPFDQRGSATSLSSLSRPAETPGKRSLRPERIISGYVSGSQTFISRLGRFVTSFAPEGHLLIAHNYDTPGMIGKVGGLLGGEGVNISAMSVAPRMREEGYFGGGAASGAAEDGKTVNGASGESGNGAEALMILSVDKAVSGAVVEKLNAEEGILRVNTVGL